MWICGLSCSARGRFGGAGRSGEFGSRDRLPDPEEVSRGNVRNWGDEELGYEY